ncbi:unnamed protein product, partial [marine sediment metagenome]
MKKVAVSIHAIDEFNSDIIKGLDDLDYIHIDVAFGDLHWAADLYESQTYYQDHFIMTKNLMRYFLEKDEVSIDIFLNSERTPTSQVNISVYVKD